MRRLLLSCLTLAAAAALPADARAELKLPSVLGSHMVIQRDKPVVVWGWADAGDEVSVSFAGNSGKATADKTGAWKVTLPAVKADGGKAHTVTVASKGKTIELKDVLIGEVWVGSGQSNMEWPLAATHGAREAIASAKHPQVRLFHVPKVQTKEPAKDVKATWQVCEPKTIPNFSAVLYYFGLELQKELKVPVGLINSSWGGSPIEPWTVAGKASGGMYNGMIAPLMPFAVRGVVWYQGESNAFSRNKLTYRDKMEALIKGWRNVWGKEMPFYFVQIAPWKPVKGGYPEGELMPLWEAQVASLKIPHTGMAVTTDLVDDITDIHPRNKKDVGHRLALWALTKTYGKSGLVYSGPLYKGMKIDGGKVKLSFAHVGGGLKSRDGKSLTHFEIAGADGKFVPAEATLDGDTVVVQAKGVEKPTQVRFGWSVTANPNLANKEGLPASPFQTNNWQGGTGE